MPETLYAPLEPYTGDQHVTRTGDDYAVAMSDLLPQGQAWPRVWGDDDETKPSNSSVLMRVVRGLCRIWGDFEIRASKLLEMESDPRSTIELLPDWERNWGLPDPCYSEPQSISERQLALVMRMTLWGAQSREFFIGVAAMIGYTITITEYRPFFVAMDGCGDNRIVGSTGAIAGALAHRRRRCATNGASRSWHRPATTTLRMASYQRGRITALVRWRTATIGRCMCIKQS